MYVIDTFDSMGNAVAVDFEKVAYIAKMAHTTVVTIPGCEDVELGMSYTEACEHFAMVEARRDLGNEEQSARLKCSCSSMRVHVCQ